MLELSPDTNHTVSDDRSDTLLFCTSGAGVLALEGTTPLALRSAALVLAGESAVMTAETDGLALLAASVGPGADRHVPLGAREVVVPFAAAADHGAAERRSFRILLGPHNGSTRATMFVGLVRPGKASLHYHLYDEIVWPPSGPGRFHLADGGEELRAGSSFRLRLRQPHVVENTGTGVLELLGVFTPAGSPSAAYLAPDLA